MFCSANVAVRTFVIIRTELSGRRIVVYLTEDRDKWRAVVDTALNIMGP